MGTICIAKNYLKLKSKELGFSEGVIEFIVHKYINQLGNNSFPTDEYIIQQLTPKSLIVDNIEHYDNLHLIWENIGASNVYKTQNEANTAYNEALNYFEETSIKLVTLNDNTYRVDIALPIYYNENYEKELQEILAKAPRDKDGNLLAPNGKKSNLNDRLYAQVRTKAFKDWFGDWENNPKESSKIVDENGEPLVVYHTVSGDVVLQGKADFTIFDPNFESNKEYSSSLLYFTDNKLMSESYFNDNRVWRSIDEVKEELNKHIDLKNKLIPNLKLSSHQLIENFSKKFGLTAEEYIKDLGYNTIEEFLNLNYRLYTIRGILEQINELLQRIDFLTTIIENPNKLIKTRAFFINERTPFIVDAKGHNWNELTTKGYNVEDIIKEINDAKSYRNELINLAINKYIPNEIADVISIEELEEQLPEELLNEVELKVNEKYPNINNLESTRSIENLIIDNPDYDGTLIKNVIDWGSTSWKYNWNEIKKTGTVIAVKNSNQIKSAESNIGSFSRTNDRIDRFGGQEEDKVNQFNIDAIDTSKVDIEFHDKPWKNDNTKSNKTIRIYLKGQHEKGYFELVKDYEYGLYSVHFKTTKEGAAFNSPTAITSTKEDRKTLFKELVKAIPEGATVSTWGSLSDEGVKGLNNVGRDMIKVGERTVESKADGRKFNIPIFKKPIKSQEERKLTILESLPVKIDNSLIEEFYNNLDKNNPYHQVFKLIIDIIRANNMSIDIKTDFNRQDIAMARLNGLKSVDITFNPERLLKYLMTFDKSLGRDLIMRILTHELIHSITASILESHTSWSKIRGFDEALTRFNKEINDLYNQALEQLKDEGYYGMNNPKEFISEALTNPNLQLRLALIKSKNTNKNIFQRIVDSIVNLFNNLFKKQGIDINNTLLEDVLRVSLDYFNYAKEGLNKDIDNFDSRNDAFGEDVKGEKISDKNTFKGKEERETKSITFANSTQLKSYNEFVEKQGELNTIIKFNPLDHSYTINGVRADYSVTQYRDFKLNARPFTGFHADVSSRLGTVHDEFLRDFFMDKIKDSYSNLSSSQLEDLKELALKLKIDLQSLYGDNAIFITDENLLKIAMQIDSNGLKYLVAGTMDMIVIDEKGDYHVVDFKTKRTNSGKNDLELSTLNKYNMQINLYKKALSLILGKEANVKSISIALFNIKYPDGKELYKYIGNQILFNGKNIQENEQLQLSNEYSSGKYYGTTEFEDDKSVDLYDNIEPVSTDIQNLKAAKQKDFEIAFDKKDTNKKSSNKNSWELWFDNDERDNKNKSDNTESKDQLIKKIDELTLTVKSLEKVVSKLSKELSTEDTKYDKEIDIPEGLPIELGDFIRDKAEKDSKTLYIFTDNTNRDSGSELISDNSLYALKYGKGLHYPKMTTAVVRGLDNARPVSTQRYYKKGEDYKNNRWKDEDIEEFKKVIDAEFNDIFEAWKSGKYSKIIIPKEDGFFNAKYSGISKDRTPKLYNYLHEKLNELYTIVALDLEQHKKRQLEELQEKLKYDYSSSQKDSNNEENLRVFEDKYFSLNQQQEEKSDDSLEENKNEFTAKYSLSMSKYILNTRTEEYDVTNEKGETDIIKESIIYTKTYLTDLFTLSLRNIVKCLPYSSLLSLDTKYINYNFLYTLDSLMETKQLYPLWTLQKVVLTEDLIPIAESMLKENKKFPYNKETHELTIPLFTVGYKYNEIVERNQRNLLLNTDIITLEELRHLAKATVYKVSEIITKIHDHVNGYQYYFGNNENDPLRDTDFTSMSRIEIIQTIGLKSLFNLVKEGKHAIFDIRNFDINTPFSILDKIGLISDNWEAFIQLGYDTLINVEEIALDSKNSNQDFVKSDRNDILNDEEESTVQELFGSSIEHWQVGFRQVSAVSSLSKYIKNMLDTLYQIDENGDIITDEIGVGQHLNAQEAASKILYYTQGSRNINEMIDKLKQQTDIEPWINQVLYYLEDLYDDLGNVQRYADELLRSQFYSNFRKYFQKYSITTKGKDGKLNVLIINENSYSDTLHDASHALELGFALGNFNLKTKEGNVNDTIFNELKSLVDDKLNDFIDKMKNKGKLSEIKDFNMEDYINTIKRVYQLLNIDTPNTLTLTKIYSIKENFRGKNGLYNKLSYLLNTIDKNRLGISENKQYITDFGEYKAIINIVGKYMGLEMESVFYEAGKLYYSFVMPSYLGRLVEKLSDTSKSKEEYMSFINNEYLQYDWFYKDNKIRNYMLYRLVNNKEVRENFKHVTSLHFLHTEYTEKTPVLYIASMMAGYFYDNNKKWSYFRIPTISNKPSEEYIKFERISTAYKTTIIQGLYQVFLQELDRILAVRSRRNINESIKIANFDSFIENNEDGSSSIKVGNGEKFMFLDWVLPYLDGTYTGTIEYKLADSNIKLMMDEFSLNLNDKLNKELTFEDTKGISLVDSFKRLAEIHMESKYQEARNQWINEGFITVNDKNQITDVFNFSKTLKDGKKEPTLTEEDLREFFYNDTFAAINILQLTITDTAYYKDSEELQKRLAQIHAPGMVANIEARDIYGDKYSDGYERTMYIKDSYIKSEIITNLKIAFDKILEDYKGKATYNELKTLFKFILDTANDINVTDAQGFSCPTSYRKKMALFGNWGNEQEEAYQMIMHPEDYPDQDLTQLIDIIWQPLKPFVYSQIPKNGYNSNLEKLKVGVQNKNSEYVILILDALMRRGNQPNRLSALFDFMESTQKDGKGIDTILFESTVKAGLLGALDINTLDEEGIKQVLNNAAFNADGTYNTDFVHEIPFEDYIIQQNVPSHFRDHYLSHGSLVRILGVSDLLDYDENGNNNYITIDGKEITVSEAKLNYFKAISDNINISLNQLIERFKLNNTDERERNIALSRILKDAILKDARFGADLYWAVDTNEYGLFNIPLSDPVLSDRIQKLLNSVIKNTINKQEIAGGPVVLATSWGLSDDLHIRFNSYDGRILLTQEEFETEKMPTDYSEEIYVPKDDYTSYEDYVSDNQEGIAYFECYVPVLDKNIITDFMKTDSDGNQYIDTEAMKEANPYLLKMMSYRIPTESKYSMVPIKVKGFVNNLSGELIMMPKEITWLSGSDFDKI